MKTAQEYKASIAKLQPNAYILGKKTACPSEHPLIIPSLNSAAMTYELAHDDTAQELSTAVSSLSGQRINRFTHLHQNTNDLVNKVKLQRLLGQKTATCFQRCVGMDALNTLDSATFAMDAALGSHYHQRFRSYLRYVQDNDLMCDGAMTDPKGDRSKSPSAQADPDLFLRIVAESADGVIVNGAKCHQTGALNSHEIIVMPTMAMRQEDADYAICFALPSDSQGITYILGRQASDTRKMEGGNIDVGNACYGGQECLVVFDHVFVPWERVFMYKEYQYAGMLVERFAGYHRQSYGGCKVGIGDVLIGATASILAHNGLSRPSHIREKLIEMNHLNETLFACGIACSAEGKPTESGTYIINLLLANICKLNVTRLPYEIARLAEDLAGGLMVTMPSEWDLANPQTADYIRKYLCAAEGIAVECRMKMLRLVENLTIGAAAVAYRTESMHGAGSPQAMRVMIERQVDMEGKKELACHIACGGGCAECRK